MRQYEGMFLFDATFANDFKNVEQEIDRIMKRAQAEILICRKWEERKLAFEIEKRKRGCYVLVYFRADPTRIAGIERDCALSDHILRVLVLRVDGMSRERMEAMYPQRATATPTEDEKPVTPTTKAPAAAPPAPGAGGDSVTSNDTPAHDEERKLDTASATTGDAAAEI